MILESGAIVYDCEEDKILFAKTLEEDTIRKLMDIYHKKDVMIHIFSNAYSYVEKCKLDCLETYQMELFRDTFENHCRTFDDVDAFIEEHLHEIEKINFYHKTTEDQLDSKELVKDIDITKVLLSGVSIEMNEKGVHKGLGITKLCEHLNMDVKEVIAVGDSDNDLEILETVGLAVGMGNANERVKAIADVIVSDNEHCGVKEAIDKYLLNK
jgi:Cof subfamily protein (haloacid dehalogenase superfamily)